jgi:hypothetical protein
MGCDRWRKVPVEMNALKATSMAGTIRGFWSRCSQSIGHGVQNTIYQDSAPKFQSKLSL